MLPDDDFIDLERPKPRTNLAALKELARRADAGQDPLDGMEQFYAELVAEENKKLKWRFK